MRDFKIDFLDLLQLMLIYLKLTEEIDWNWPVVLFPFWILLIAIVIPED